MSLKGTIKHLNKRLSLMPRGMTNGVTAPCGKLGSQASVHLCCNERSADHPACWNCGNRITRHLQWEGLEAQRKINQRNGKKILAAMGAAASASWQSDQAPEEQEDGNGTGRHKKTRGPKRGAKRTGTQGQRSPRRRPSTRS